MAQNNNCYPGGGGGGGGEGQGNLNLHGPHRPIL